MAAPDSNLTIRALLAILEREKGHPQRQDKAQALRIGAHLLARGCDLPAEARAFMSRALVEFADAQPKTKDGRRKGQTWSPAAVHRYIAALQAEMPGISDHRACSLMAEYIELQGHPAPDVSTLRKALHHAEPTVWESASDGVEFGAGDESVTAFIDWAKTHEVSA
ncbi:MAG: hypothetical protein ACLFSG_02555 [Halothiobacillaceae bacterium]